MATFEMATPHNHRKDRHTLHGNTNVVGEHTQKKKKTINTTKAAENHKNH
jgi:hypothetical protein